MIKHILIFSLVSAYAAQLPAAVVTVPFTIPKDSRVSLAIYDQQDRMVRTLLTGKALAKGEHSATWDGLDRYGNALPVGDYTWKLLATDGLRSEFITQVGQNTDPAWEKATGNHQPPNAAAVDATGLYRHGSVNEGAHWGVKTDLNGRTVWVNDRNQADPWMAGGEALTLVSGRLFELMRDGTVYGSDANTGRVFTGSDTRPKPWNLRWNGYVAPLGTGDDARRKQSIAERPHDMAGDTANGLLVAAYPQHDAVAWFDARDGRQVDKLDGIPGLAGIAVSTNGSVYAISQGRVIAFSRAHKTPHVIIPAERLQSPWRLTVSPKNGDIFVAENSDLATASAVGSVPDSAEGKTPNLAEGVTIISRANERHHQVKRFRSDGQVVKAFGRPEGRRDGEYVPTDFRGLTDIEADTEGGFVVTEGNHTPPRRTARFDAAGELLREWFGADNSLNKSSNYDVVVYGGSPGGIAAGVAAAREGASILLLEPTRHVGGLHTSGLTVAEWAQNRETFGGILDEFFRRLGQAYGSKDRKYEWESKVAERVYQEMLREANVAVMFEKVIVRIACGLQLDSR